MSATLELSKQKQETTESDSRPAGLSHTEAVAWAMFVAGYNARIEDASREIEFRDRESFDAHLYEQFRTVYTDL